MLRTSVQDNRTLHDEYSHGRFILSSTDSMRRISISRFRNVETEMNFICFAGD